MYEKEFDKPTHKPICLRLQSDNPITAYLLQKEYNFTQKCPFVLKTTSHFISTCSNSRAKSLGADFDGYLRLELYEKRRLLYRDQMDFKGCLSKRVVKMLFEKVEKRYF